MATVQTGKFEYVTRLKRRATLRCTTGPVREAPRVPGTFHAAKQALAPFDPIGAVREGRIPTAPLKVVHVDAEGVRVRPFAGRRERVMEGGTDGTAPSEGRRKPVRGAGREA